VTVQTAHIRVVSQGEPDLRVVAAERVDLERYVDLLEELADWLETRGITQWPRGRVRRSSAYFADSIARQEVQLAFVGNELAGTLRFLMNDPIVWPEFTEPDAVYVYNLGVRRAWAGRELGGRLLDWAEHRAAGLGRRFVRLDCVPGNAFLRDYYERKGFIARGDVDAQYPDPVGLQRLRRYEKAVHA
jgi:GNAT superfamily N-acetyltransferase